MTLLQKSNGVALNDCMYAGPPFVENIFDVLLRFRVNQVALTGDIEKALLMVGMAEEHRTVLRFLWVDAIDKPSPEVVVLRFSSCVKDELLKMWHKLLVSLEDVTALSPTRCYF